MRDKTHVTLMVCMGVAGEKVPLHIVGKSKRPECFKLLRGRVPPVYCTPQKKAWYDRPTTLRWISELFAPWLRKNSLP